MKKGSFIFVVFLIFSDPSASAQEAKRGVPVSPENSLQKLLSRAEEVQGIEPRLHFFSRAFLGKPYGISPLGEGKGSGYDQDPLWRLDRFDCTTFVETMLALAHSRSSQDFFENMNRVRYQRKPYSFFNRNHFFGLNWLPNLVNQLGWAEETTSTRAREWGLETHVAEALITRSAWATQISGVPILEADFPNLLETLPYISLQELLRKKPWAQFTGASILTLVRPNWDQLEKLRTHLNVSHQGLIFMEQGVPVFYQASSLKSERKVTRMKLEAYLKAQLAHKAVKGIHLLQVNP